MIDLDIYLPTRTPFESFAPFSIKRYKILDFSWRKFSWLLSVQSSQGYDFQGKPATSYSIFFEASCHSFWTLHLIGSVKLRFHFLYGSENSSPVSLPVTVVRRRQKASFH